MNPEQKTWNVIASWQNGDVGANGWTRVPRGWTGVVATVGGHLPHPVPGIERPWPRRFLVPAHEYKNMMRIDESRHLPWPAVANETGQPDIVYTCTPTYNMKFRHHVIKLRELLPPGRDDHAAEVGEVWRFDADEKLDKPARWRAFRYGRSVEEGSLPAEGSLPTIGEALASVGFRLAPLAPVRAVPCPDCPAKAGGPCQRPSEHRVDDGFAHRKRQLAAQAVDDERAAAGDLAVPALWPTRTTTPTVEPDEQMELLLDVPTAWKAMLA